jgi:hypothetical protein
MLKKIYERGIQIMRASYRMLFRVTHRARVKWEFRFEHFLLTGHTTCVHQNKKTKDIVFQNILLS